MNRPTRVKKSSAIIIDHVLTMPFITGSEVQSGMTKVDTSDYFAMFVMLRTSLVRSNIKNNIIKRDINEDFKYFKSILNSVDWNLITQTSTTDDFNIYIYI